MLKWHHHITLFGLIRDLQIGLIESKLSAIQIPSKISKVVAHIPFMWILSLMTWWWWLQNSLKLHWRIEAMTQTDLKCESSPISNKLQTMKLLSHICNSCLMTQWYIDSHVLEPCSADSLALLSVISVCWTVIQHSPDQGGPHSYQTWQLGSKIHCIALLNVFSWSCNSIILITNFEAIIS